MSTNVHCGYSQQSLSRWGQSSSLYLLIKISFFKHGNKLSQWNCRHQEKLIQLAATHIQLVFLLFTFYQPFRLGRYHPPWLSFRSTQILPHESLEISYWPHESISMPNIPFPFQCQTFNIKLSSFTAEVIFNSVSDNFQCKRLFKLNAEVWNSSHPQSHMPHFVWYLWGVLLISARNCEQFHCFQTTGQFIILCDSAAECFELVRLI